MTRKESEEEILSLIWRAYKLFKEFNPDGNHLTMFGTDEGMCAMGYRKEGNKWTQVMDAFKSADGACRTTDRRD